MRITARRIAVLLPLLTLTAVPSKAGKFKWGLNHSIPVTLKVPVPPAAYLGKKLARVNPPQVPPNFSQGDRLFQSIQQNLSPDFDTTSASPEVILSVTVASYDQPSTQISEANETRLVKVGEQQLYNKDGTPKKDWLGNPMKQDIFENRVVPVVYWHGSASLSLRVEVKSPDGVLLDSFNPVSNFDRRITVSVNNVAEPGGANQPDASSILSELVNSVAGQFKTRYCQTERPETFLLAADDELRSGDTIAQAGNWAEALKDWQGVRMKKNQSDQEYNIAAAYEALAYAQYKQGDMDKTIDSFKQAMNLYTKAMEEDPSEKYIRQAHDRLQAAQNAIESARKQYAVQQAEAEKLDWELKQREEANQARMKQQEEVNQEIQNQLQGNASAKPDTPDEASFREMVRLQLKDAPGGDANGLQHKLVMDGQQIYKLDPQDAMIIVTVETKRQAEHETSMNAYREAFAEYASHHRITAEERASLEDMRKRMNLSAEDVHSIESQFHFEEDGRTTRAVRTRRTAAAPKKD
jgi:tetratricopeptide (TPR) repeat protein